MTTRSLSLLAAVLLAGLAAPAPAQERYDPGEPPPLPDLSEREWDEWDADPQEPYPDEPGEGDPYGMLPPASGKPDPRAAWLDECRARMGPRWDDGRDSCETYLRDYERSGAAPAGREYRYGYLPGYPGRVMWVRVPVERGRSACREASE